MLLLCHLQASPVLTYSYNSALLNKCHFRKGMFESKGLQLLTPGSKSHVCLNGFIPNNHPSKWEVQLLVDVKCHPHVPFFQVVYSYLQQHLFLSNPDKLC